MKIVIPYSAELDVPVQFKIPETVFDRFNWQAYRHDWQWMNAEALCDLLDLPFNKSVATWLGMRYRKQPRATVRKSNGVRLMLIPPMRDTL